jgi:hypothetical protein
MWRCPAVETPTRFECSLLGTLGMWRMLFTEYVCEKDIKMHSNLLFHLPFPRGAASQLPPISCKKQKNGSRQLAAHEIDFDALVGEDRRRPTSSARD